jgi:branched-chain amino acid transport system substrate-binding protein
VLKTIGAGSVVAATGGRGLADLPDGVTAKATPWSSGTITIGFVYPKTGALADFAQSDGFVLGKISKTGPYAKGFKIGHKTYDVKVITKDSQSSPSQAAIVTQQLILQDGANIVLTTSTPETIGPVAATCETYRVPCLSTVCPWESWYGFLGGNPGNPTKTFQYCTMFFFGLKEFAGCFLPMWNRIESRTHAPKIFGGMYPNDDDGNAFRALFPGYAKKDGYKFVDGGAFVDGSSNYTSMISKFKQHGVEFFSNCPLPPDFNTFWKQAVQQKFRPKLATVAKVLLFPSDVIALGRLVDNIATDAWWTIWSPYKSSLNGETCNQLGRSFEAATGKQWVQSLGSTYSLFEIAEIALKAAGDPHDAKAVAAELHKVKYTGICGPMNFAKGPAPGVGIIKPVGVQWKPAKQYSWQPFVVDNSLNREVPINGDLKPTNT